MNMQSGRQLIIISIFCSMLCVLLCTGNALAQPTHGEYVSSVPAANAMLTQAPTVITVHFSEAIDPNQSDIQVYDVNDKLVSTAPAKLNGTDHQTMAVPMQANGSEIYLVNWHNVSTDEGHRDSGSFRFFVNISRMLKGMVKGEAMGHMPGTTMAAAHPGATISQARGIPTWLTVLLSGMVGLLIGAGATFAMLQQQKIRYTFQTEENTLGKK
ncbi:copper resistance CopC family protein [Dictyobacter kobayashii]|uniref:CopC domain-containing protein n=1 Tax=Dictyobacter kobayashii TaxID=2014872 RepID=A0A402AY75_9CHLR|nr:copper resistance CopC family protein [Dictyobacter kobayashii]GCE24003.1 hypothetical protein KDK_78030 [Dictyobacter kobayashii]